MGWLRRLRATIVGSNARRSLDEELQFHIEARTEEFMREGLPREAARREALRRFGNVTLTRERTQDVDTVRWLHDLGRDVRYALRTFRRSPGFASVVILSLALGIGANSAIFSLVNSVFLRTLPVPDPSRLATVGTAGAGGHSGTWSYAVWNEVRKHAQMFDGASACSSVRRFGVSDGTGAAERVDGLLVSGDFFKNLGVAAIAGRVFTAADDVPTVEMPDASGHVTEPRHAEPVAVISHSLWQRRYGSALSVVGTRLVIDNVPFTIVGVAPREFFGVEVGRAFDVAIPLGAEPLMRGGGSVLENRGFSFLSVLVRLKPGQSIEEATQALRGVQPQIRAAAMPASWPAEFRREFLNDPFMLSPAAAGLSPLRHQYRRPLVAMGAVVALVLLIACANIANLLLARATARRHEMGLRLALGAARARLVRQLMIESLLLAGVGAGAGLFIAVSASKAIVGMASTPARQILLDLSLDWRVLIFTAAVTITTVILFGMAPALRATRVDPTGAMKERARSEEAATSQQHLTNGLVVAQAAVSVVLVVAAGLFVRTFQRIAAVPLGFDADRVLLVNVSAPRARVGADGAALTGRLVDGLLAVPGVEHAAASLLTPVGGNGLIDVVNLPSAPPARDLFLNGRPNPRSAVVNFVTPGWFSTYGTTIRAGRDIDKADTANSPPVVVVNEAFVRKFLKRRDAIGATFSGLTPQGQPPQQKTIIGVVADAIYDSLRAGVPPTMYAPMAQATSRNPWSEISISVRAAAGAPARLAPSIAAALRQIDPSLMVSFRPLADQVSASFVQERLVATVSGLFALLGVLLAALGLYGVVTYTVARRRAEMGIRIALGAGAAAVVRLVLARVAMLVAVGQAIGTGVSLWAARLASSLLFGVEPRDPSTIAWAVLLLAATAAVSAWIPARQASRIDPAEVLREAQP